MTQEKALSLLLFSVGEKRFFIDIGTLEEIIPYQTVTRLPGASAIIEGITNFRGQIIGVYDLPKILEIPEDNDRKSRIIVVKNNNEKYGIVASKVFEVANISGDDLKKSYGHYLGIALYKNEEIFILNPARLQKEEPEAAKEQEAV